MNCKKKPISECFYLTKYRNKQKISIQQIVQLWKKLQHYLKIIIYGQICFFFWWQVTLRQVTMNFRYTDFGPYLARKRLLYWHWTLRTTKLTFYKRWFRSIHLQYGQCCGFINVHRSRNWKGRGLALSTFCAYLNITITI